VIILTKYPCIFREVDFPESFMSRTLLIAEPVGGINGQQVLVATARFESLNNEAERKR